jgi:hypothetical protein
MIMQFIIRRKNTNCYHCVDSSYALTDNINEARSFNILDEALTYFGNYCSPSNDELCALMIHIESLNINILA